MGYKATDINNLEKQLGSHISGFNIFDLPAGRHKNIIEEFYVVQKNKDADDYAAKLNYVNEHLHDFNTFLETQGRYKSERLDAERQAQLEPERMKAALKALSDLGFRPEVVNNTEVNFSYKDAIIKYYPYSGWASGKTIKDGRGLKNLLEQLTYEGPNQYPPFEKAPKGYEDNID
jgi:hypothetical protein